MRLPAVVISSLVALGVASPAAIAMPRAPLIAGTAVEVTPVALGCGAGRTRDARGRCHHRFNLFRHHDRFHAYTKRHCTRMRTPNGSVKRCRI